MGEPERRETDADGSGDVRGALGNYVARMRRARIVYAAVIAALVTVAGVGVGIAWSHGEISHVSSHTVPTAPASLPVGAPSPDLKPAWRSADRAAIGVPQWGGTVVVWSDHTVRGIDARTGAHTWSYTRTDRTVCTAAQAAGTTIAVYRNGGNCDEVTALDSATGARRWTRTLDEDGKPINGTPRYQVLPSTFIVYTPASIYAIDPGSGIDRWIFHHYGCSIENVAVGSGGALISQKCSKAEKCGELKFCGHGPQLLLRDAFAGYDDKSKTNPDQIQWNLIGNPDVPVSADQLISALSPATHALDTFGADKGTPTGSIRLQPRPDSVQNVLAVDATTHEVVSIAGTIYAVSVDKRRVRWTARAAGPPTVVPVEGSDLNSLATARVTVPAPDGIRILDGTTGRIAQTYAVPAPPQGSLVYPLGTGFLLAAPNATVAYR